ncbi:PREDICTED: C-type lectin domain family 5 member A-like [Gekko japonicus]|uniref:C-type lectin domain family 5 member A-like n=1 Tax=Gekko japonicus TaxID=146911 RepID=A0ABM1JXG1_GEKJA|nr:PREDICTED: C-type lectin domain family 5 member A-like [Gekko japonicus]
MGWRQVTPGIILVLVKLIGTSLFVTFIPQIFPRGNFSFVSEENGTVPQTPPSLTLTEGLTTTTPVEITTAVQLPSLRWERFGRSSYGFSEYMLAWSSSHLECQELSSDLVIINDEEEMEFLQNRTRNADYFIGLEYPDNGNKWFWHDGTEPRADLFIMKPNNENKQCATLRGRELSPASCFKANRWICEKKNG